MMAQPLDDARQFLTLLDPEAEAFTFQTFDDTGKKRSSLARVIHGPLDKAAFELNSLQKRGAGAFVTINETDLEGRQADNVVRVRAVFVDLDGAPLKPALECGITPHIIIESSPGRWHCYWLVNDCPLEKFEPIQRALAAKFNGDTSVHDLSRVMRLPGFVHQKKEPSITKLMPELGSGDPSISIAEIIEKLALDLSPKTQEKKAHVDGMIERGERHGHLFAMGRTMRTRGMSQAAVMAALAAENTQRCNPPVPDADVADLATRSFTAKDSASWSRDQERPENNGHDNYDDWTQNIPPEGEPKGKSPNLKVYPAPEFCSDLPMFTTVIKRILNKRTIYALTGNYGSGKTSMATLMEVCIASGIDFAGQRVNGGKVLCLCGENPYDKQLRVLACCQQLNIGPPEDLYVIPGRFSLYEKIGEIAAYAKEHGPFSFVTVDTSIAYLSGNDENSNVEMVEHAIAMRELTTLNGDPCVMVLCHPVKNAGRDNLVPRGASSFTGEIDANLTCWCEDGIVSLHHTKLRQAPFSEIEFNLDITPLDGHMDADGDPVVSVTVHYIDEEEARSRIQDSFHLQNRVLRAMLETPNGSISGWATACGVAKGAAQTTLKRMLIKELVARNVDGVPWSLTKSGRTEAGRDRS